MNILVIGRGGREHAIVHKLSQSHHKPQIFVAPGNPGIQQLATCVPIDELDNLQLLNFAQTHHIDLTIVGPENPLINGIADLFQRHHLNIFAPTQKAAIIEGSKDFTKQLMSKYHIPTAAYATFDNFENAKNYLLQNPTHLVIKADGLAAGKGVVVAQTTQQAIQACDNFLNKKTLGQSGQKIVIEEFLQGNEFSLMAFVNGTNVFPMELARDYKRAFDNHQGPNTGGMGAYSPVPDISPQKIHDAVQNILIPTAHAMQTEGRPFCGILYAGLIDTPQGIKVIEFNARFGDPETEVVLPRLKNDLIDVLFQVLKGQHVALQWQNTKSVGVVIAAQGYPQNPIKNFPLHGLDKVQIPLFHMGTSLQNQHLIASGGRVLLLTSQAQTFDLARQQVYNEIQKINPLNLFYRKDIAQNLD